MTSIDFSAAVCAVAAHERAQWPADGGAEVAFVGRSNSGKSSALNAIAGRRNLARASKAPGRTRQIVFFAVGGELRLVDLPGYGYAKAPDHLRRHWERATREYLTGRACLKALVLTADIRRGLTDLDRLMARICGDLGRPAHLLLTKADKLPRGRANDALRRVGAELAAEIGGAKLTAQLFSAVDKQGVDEAREKVCGWLLE